MASVDLGQSTIFSRLRGLLEVTRLVRTGEELPELLAAIARTISDSLAFRTVVVNLYRREWDDFIVTTVHGSDDARAALLGQVQPPSEWEPLLDARFLQRGAYFIPAGELDWDAVGGTTYTPDLAVSSDPTAWHPDDALFTPMRGPDGALLGILSVDEPVSGHRPSGDEIDVLVAVSEHAALAVQAAQEAARAQANRGALERLLAVSTTLNETSDTSRLLAHVCRAISEALGFEKVAVRLLDDGGLHRAGAQIGFADAESMGSPLTVDELERLLRLEFDVAGCFVVPDSAARATLPGRPADYRSQRDGRGAYAWQNHWLFVPLTGRQGDRMGYIWVDEPTDRLLPDADRLRILRAFANQATTALEQAAQFEEIQNAYEHHRASEARKDAILRAALDSVVIVDHEGLIVEVNTATEETFGWTRPDAVGKPFLELVVAADDRGALTDVLTAGSPLLGARLEITALRSDRRSFPAELAITRVDVPGPLLFAVSLRDVTKRHQHEERLRQAEAKYRTLVEQLPLATYVNAVGLPVQTTYMSPQIERMLGYPVSRWLEPAFFDSVLHEDDRERVQDEVTRTHQTGETFRMEYRLIAADGAEVWVLDETAAVRDAEYRPILLQGCLVDVTDRHDAARLEHSAAA